ncbi:hypothetical protein ACQ86D_26130 [Streptomyces galilaeus]
MTGIAGRPAVPASGFTARPLSAVGRGAARPLPTTIPVTGVAQ